MKDAKAVFERYEQLRHRLPQVNRPNMMQGISSLLDIADQADAFIFDAYGVLNVGDKPIEGAADRLSQLRAMGLQIRILTNAASFHLEASVEKFRRLGMQVSADEIITSRSAALADASSRLWGCIAAPWDDLRDIPGEICRLELDHKDYDRVGGFLFLSTEVWNDECQALLETSLQANPRPVLVANADLVAPRSHGLSLEPGYFGHQLADRRHGNIRFFGKPYPDVYDMVQKSLGPIKSDRIVMCGDTLHTDILGAASRGWQTVLVTRDGLFKDIDVEPFCKISQLYPDWHLPRM